MIRRPVAAVGRPQLGLPRDLIASILSLALVAWSRVRASGRVSVRSHEADIAGELQAEMDLEKERRQLPFRILEETGTRSPGASKPDGRIDIMVIYSWRSREYFGIECKRVRARRTTLARKYVDQGIMRFVTSKYGEGHDWGALFGFAVDGACDPAAEGIRDQLAVHPSVSLTVPWALDITFGSIPHLYRTVHTQSPGGGDICLLHLFLAV